MGNHDALLVGIGYEGARELLGMKRRYYSFDHKGWHFVVLDSSVPGHGWGRVAGEQLSWLKEDLAALGAGPANVVVCLHHHVFPTGQTWLNGIMLREPQDLLECMQACEGKNFYVFCGHVHTSSYWRRKNVFFSSTPSTGSPFEDSFKGFRIVEAGVNGPYLRTLAVALDGLAVPEIAPEDYPVYDESMSEQDTASRQRPLRRRLRNMAEGTSAGALLFVRCPLDDQKFIVEDYGVGKIEGEGGYRFVDRRAALVYRFPPAKLRHTGPMTLNIRISSDYKIAVSRNGEDFKELFCSKDKAHRALIRWEIPKSYYDKSLFVRIGDASPQDDYGAQVHAIAICEEKPQ